VKTEMLKKSLTSSALAIASCGAFAQALAIPVTPAKPAVVTEPAAVAPATAATPATPAKASDAAKEKGDEIHKKVMEEGKATRGQLSSLLSSAAHSMGLHPHHYRCISSFFSKIRGQSFHTLMTDQFSRVHRNILM
jgi:hypothetical protein